MDNKTKYKSFFHFKGANDEDEDETTMQAPSGDTSENQTTQATKIKPSTPKSPKEPPTEVREGGQTPTREPTNYSQRQKTKSVSNLWKPTNTGTLHSITLNKALHETGH